MGISLNQAREIANETARNFGYNPLRMNIKLDERNTAWGDLLSADFGYLESDPDLKRKLESKEFFAVYYEPKRLILGGDLWIFIDQKTGEVLGVIRGR